MNQKILALLSLLLGATCACHAASLQFTNVSSALVGLTNTHIKAVAYGGDMSFVAVGNNGAVLRARFLGGASTNLNFVSNYLWTTSSVPITNLRAVGSDRYNDSFFLTAGTSNLVFTSDSGTDWPPKPNSKVFSTNNTADAAGFAFNSGKIVCVAAAPAISWSTNGTQWAAATIQEVSFLESYRAVTPFGTNGFAACGILGVVRTSTDGGANWQHVHGGTSEPDLLGIAAVGSTLVAVGKTRDTETNGVILTSSNNGVDWQKQKPTTATNMPLNAVASSTIANQFVAVGYGGRILTSTDGLNWETESTNPGTDLYGVAFANQGMMKGICLLAGDKGTVLLGGWLPAAPVNTGNATNCADSTPNPPLCVTNLVGDYHPGGTVAVDWYDERGELKASDSFCYTPTNTQAMDDNTPRVYPYYAQARDRRTGFVSANRSTNYFQVNPRPKATLRDFGTNVCNYGSNYVLKVDLTGVGPWTVTWNDGSPSQTTNASPGSGATLLRTVYPTNYFKANLPSNNVYYVTSVTTTNNGCVGNQPGDIKGTNTVVVNPRPTATLRDFGTTVCNYGSNYVLAVDLTGVGPWTVTWNDGSPPQTTSAPLGSGATLLRTVYPTNYLGANLPSNNVYYVTGVSTANGCAGNQPGDITGRNTVVVNPRPTATLRDFGTTVCNYGSNYVLKVDLTGLGPWTVTWNDGSPSQTTNASPGSGATLLRTVYPTNYLKANLPSNNVYYVTSVSETNGCVGNQPGDITGTNTVVVNPRPTATLTDTVTVCNGQSPEIHALLTGIGPWTVRWSDGEVQETGAAAGGPVTLVRRLSSLEVTNVLENQPTNHYFYVTNVSNANGCVGNQPGDITGTNTVVVNPRPTAKLRSLDTTVCNYGSNYVLAVDLKGLGPWTVTWNDGSPPQTTNAPAGSGATLLRTVYPTNYPEANLASNNVYYVTSVSTTNGCVGNQAGDITGTNTVVVNPRPTAKLRDFGTTGCNYGNNYVLEVDLTGVGPWTVTWNDGSQQQTTPAPAGSGATLLRTVYPTNYPGANLASNNVYYVTSVSTTNGCVGNQPGDISGTNTVVVNPRPTAKLRSLDTTVCNYGSNYVFAVDLTGLGPWTLTWNDGSPPQTINAPAGSGATLLRTVYPTNYPGANLPSNNVYHVTSVSTANGCAGNQPGDITGTNTVVVDPRPTAMLRSLAPTDCNYGGNHVLAVDLTGLGPWTVTWNDGSQQQTNPAPPGGGATLLRTVYPTNYPGANLASNNVYYVTGVSNANSCVGNQPGDIRGTNTVVVNPRPTAKLRSLDTTVCNDGSNYVLAVDLTGHGPWTVTWNDGSQQQTNPAPAGGGATLLRTVYPTNASDVCGPSNNVYYVTNVSTANGCAGNQAGDITGTNTVTVNPRPTARLTSVDAANCNNGTSYLIIATLKGQSPWIITWNDGTRETNSSVGCPVLHTRTVYPTNASDVCGPSKNVYYMAALADGNHCEADGSKGDLLVTNTVTVNPRPTAHLSSADATNCNNGTAYMLSTTLKGQSPWIITWNDGTRETNSAVGCPVIHTRTVYPTNASDVCGPSNNVYYVAALSDGNQCVADGGKGDLPGRTTVTVHPRPTARLTSLDVTNCNNGTTYQVVATLKGQSPWIITWNDGTRETNSSVVCPVLHTRTVYPTNATDVCGPSNNVYYVAALTDGNQCVADAAKGDLPVTNTVTVNPRPTVRLTSVNTNQCNDGTAYQISATLKGQAPWTITWNDGTVETITNSGCPVFHTRTVYPTNSPGASAVSNHVYYVTALTDGNACVAAGAKGDIQGTNTVGVNPPPTARIAGSGQVLICSNDCGSLALELTGTPPWKLWWSDGSPPTTVSVSPYVHVVCPTNTLTYTITNLTDAIGCPGTELGSAVTVTVTNCASGLNRFLVISLDGTRTNAVLTWGGNRWLQSSPWLTNSLFTNVVQGTAPGTTNSRIWTIPSRVEQRFFRLAAPTNSP